MKTGLLLLVMALVMTKAFVLYADDRDDLSEHVLQWVKEGKVLSFEIIQERYKERLQGRILDLEVEREDGRIIYELEIMRDDSVVYEIKIDAQSGEWLEEERED